MVACNWTLSIGYIYNRLEILKKIIIILFLSKTVRIIV